MAKRGHSKSITQHLALTALAETRWGPKRHWRCVYCGRGAGLVVDHFDPTHLGGTDALGNLFPACDRCNTSKQAFDPWAWMEAVGVPPRRISALMTIRNRPETWRPPAVPNERFALDYAAARALKASVGLFQGD